MHLEEAVGTVKRAFRGRGLVDRKAILKFSEAIDTLRFAGTHGGSEGAAAMLEFVAVNLDCAGEC